MCHFSVIYCPQGMETTFKCASQMNGYGGPYSGYTGMSIIYDYFIFHFIDYFSYSDFLSFYEFWTFSMSFDSFYEFSPVLQMMIHKVGRSTRGFISLLGDWKRQYLKCQELCLH